MRVERADVFIIETVRFHFYVNYKLGSELWGKSSYICEESDFTLDPSLKECSFSFRKCKRKLRWLSFFITVEFSTSFPSFYTCSTLTYFSLYQSQNTHPNQDPFTLPTCGSCFRIQQMPDQSKEQLSQLSSFFIEWKFVFTISKVQ